MRLDQQRLYGLLAVILAAAGCAGNGQGLDQNGQPISAGDTSGSTEITADLASIEANVFTPICSKCHIGAGAPEGLQLDAAHAYDFLVGVPSAEEPSLLRVNPGNPDSSYMLMKIEGAPGIEGSQMPLGETPLPAATIAAIRQWIANGAPNVTAAPAAVVSSFEVRDTFPADQSALAASPTQVLVAFTGEIDASLVNETSVQLDRLAESGVGDTPIPVARKVIAANPSVLLLTPQADLGPGTYRIRMRSNGGAGLADVNARVLRSDTSFEFNVESHR